MTSKLYYGIYKLISIRFIDVIGFQMFSDDMWIGPDNSIYNFYYDEQNPYELTNQIIQRRQIKENNVIKELSKEDIIEVKFLLISGDLLIIACKEIEYDEAPLPQEEIEEVESRRKKWESHL